jgi:GNAT superfamily N-acetyltransferase
MPLDRLTIREATFEDAAAIGALARGLAQRFVTHELPRAAASALLETMSEAGIRERMIAGCRYHVAELEGGMIGLVGVKDNRHLYHLFVAEDHQRQGIGRALWHTARDACLAAGNPGRFTVNASRYARPVYERLGFRAHAGEQQRHGVVTIPMVLHIDA